MNDEFEQQLFLVGSVSNADPLGAPARMYEVETRVKALDDEDEAATFRLAVEGDPGVIEAVVDFGEDFGEVGDV